MALSSVRRRLLVGARPGRGRRNAAAQSGMGELLAENSSRVRPRASGVSRAPTRVSATWARATGRSRRGRRGAARCAARGRCRRRTIRAGRSCTGGSWRGAPPRRGATQSSGARALPPVPVTPMQVISTTGRPSARTARSDSGPVGDWSTSRSGSSPGARRTAGSQLSPTGCSRRSRPAGREPSRSPAPGASRPRRNTSGPA